MVFENFLVFEKFRISGLLLINNKLMRNKRLITSFSKNKLKMEFFKIFENFKNKILHVNYM